ncbi:aminopeptidase, partial [Sulfobacillus acidophilus]|nr:aminopeptidase [Sulfobacillus acidophilus]
SIPYLVTQGYYQAKLLYGAKSVEQVLKENELTKEQRQKLELVLKVRKFSAQKLGLNLGKNYSAINMSFKHTIYNVSASEALKFEPYTWWFPIVGSVPYKGFFNKKDAQIAFEKLKEKKYDVMMRVVTGYSTLGYFNDPIWVQMLAWSDQSLTELIIHELAHSTLYFPSHSNFNESFAMFVGKKGTLEFLASNFGKNSAIYLETINSYGDANVYAKFMWELYHKLNDLYESSKSKEQKTKKKNKILLKAAAQYKNLNFKTKGYKNSSISHFNNASLMSFRRYNSEQKTFEKLFEKKLENWQDFLKELALLQDEKDPLTALKNKIR